MSTTDRTSPQEQRGVPLHASDPHQLGHYHLSRRLGAGGMATVYLGRDDAGREAAVKVVRADLAGDPGFAARLAREVRVLSRISSPAVARVLDADVSGDPAWLAVELVPGESLAATVEARGPLPLAEWSMLAMQLLEAVVALHEAGVVHRDLTPANVILGPDGPRVIDFGIALSALSTRVTRTGHAIGTPGWMAPEQLHGRAVSGAADVYSTGCLLAHAATGRPPHGGGTRQEVTHRVLQSPVDVDGLPVLIQRFLGQLTAKDPADRPTATAAAQRWREVSDVVTRATAVAPTQSWRTTTAVPGPAAPGPSDYSVPPPPAPRNQRRATWTVLLVAVTLLVGLGIGALLAGVLPHLSAGPGQEAATGNSPSTAVSSLPVPSDDPTSQEQLTAVQQAVLAAEQELPGLSVKLLEVQPARDGTPTRLVADVSADFSHSFESGYALRTVAGGMGGTSARYDSCIDVSAGETQRQEFDAVDDTAGARWTSLRVELVQDGSCRPRAAQAG